MNRYPQIIIKDELQSIFDHFCACFNVQILFYSRDGQELKNGLNRPDSHFCSLVREHLYSEDKCLSFNEKMRREAETAQTMICCTCHGGVTESVHPILIENQIMGFAMIGRLRSTDTLLPELRHRWPQNRDIAELEHAFQLLPFYPDSVIGHILELFALLVDYIVSKEIITAKGNLVVANIVSYLEQNVEQSHVHLENVARYIGKSPSTISHLCKQHLGISFKHLQIETKLSKAEEYFRTEPGITVGEISERLGYTDQFYFSRIYKKYRHMPPSSYINRHDFTNHDPNRS